MEEKDVPAGKSPYHHGDLRQALLLAAEDELKDKGLEGFTLRGVAKRAGVSHAAPAHHFRDTADLLTALAAVAATRFHAEMLQAQAGAPKDARSQFIASGVGYVAFAVANPTLFSLMFGSRRADITAAEFAEPASRAFRVLVDGVAGLRGGDPLASKDGRIDILAAWSLVHGLANLLIARRLRFVDADLKADLRGMVSKVIGRVVPGPTAG